MTEDGGRILSSSVFRPPSLVVDVSMKALSIRQPWADLIVQGKKTLELRSWAVGYRGPLAIHASQTVDREACQAHGINPDQVSTGAIIGVVDLVSIIVLDDEAFASRRNEHLVADPLEGTPERFKTTPLYGWQIANPRTLSQPRPVRGRMGLFSVPDEMTKDERPKTNVEQNVGPVSSKVEFRQPASLPIESEPVPPVVEPTWDPKRPFELRVIAEASRKNQATAYQLALYQRLVEPPNAQRTMYRQSPPDMVRVVQVGGSVLKAIADHVLDALRRSGYKATDLSVARREPFLLSEESGVRLGLLFLAVKPIAKMERVEAISHGLRSMTSEEAYYWYSKCTVGPTAERAQKALRVLLSDE